MLASNQAWMSFFLRLVVALFAFGAILFWGADYHDWISLSNEPLKRITLMLGWGIFAMIVYVLVLKVCGFRFKEFIRHTQ
jgi:putative peptidoglycan lipid II flippase